MKKEYITKEAVRLAMRSLPRGVLFTKYELEEIPAVDAAEVVYAHWLNPVYDPMWRCMEATCSHCKVRGEVRTLDFKTPYSPYCPECGANMKERRP